MLYMLWCIYGTVCKLSTCNSVATLCLSLFTSSTKACLAVTQSRGMAALGIDMVWLHMYNVMQLVHQCMVLCREVFMFCHVCAQQSAIAARPSATYKGYLLGGLLW